jgi:hypothetical protein
MGALGSAPCRQLPWAPQLRPPCFVSVRSRRFRWGSSLDASGRATSRLHPNVSYTRIASRVRVIGRVADWSDVRHIFSQGNR